MARRRAWGPLSRLPEAAAARRRAGPAAPSTPHAAEWSPQASLMSAVEAHTRARQAQMRPTGTVSQGEIPPPAPGAAPAAAVP